ncbi:hypothetical protein EZJ43_00755 [Pedobacter changchengzhani]|uniref:Uncharacterized protein n=1 Tax=Pedobacter changchengzhani TaxID=2529274 RepID=A0A4R5MP85_9SPHI|nr:DUF6263 family protein [Pedobacter changchengzhani]TDG37657.1 hypothetical protein EZJ43_00755 [Pedobacter changchengzhani]
MKINKFTAVLTLTFFVALSVSAQKTYTIKQNFPIGKKYLIKMISDQFISQKIGEQNIDLKQNIGTDYTFDIRNGNDSEKNIEVTYDRIYMTSETGGNKMNIDSDDQDTTKANPFRKLKGAGFTMIMLHDGSVKSINGVDKMLNDMTSSMSKDTAVVRSIKQSLAKQFNAESLKQTMESSLKIYPSKPIKIGESWVSATKVNLAMPMEMNSTYTLKDVKGNIAYLTISGTLASKGSFDAMNNKMETDLKGTNIGDAELDLNTGLIMNAHSRIEMDGTIKAQGQNIAFKLQGITKIEAKEIK